MGYIANTNTLNQVKESHLYPVLDSNDVAVSIVHCEDFWQDIFNMYSARVFIGTQAYEIGTGKKYHLIENLEWIEDEGNFFVINSKNLISLKIYETDIEKLTSDSVVTKIAFKSSKFFNFINVLTKNFRVFRVRQYYHFLAYHMNHYTSDHNKYHPVSFHYVKLNIDKLDANFKELETIYKSITIIGKIRNNEILTEDELAFKNSNDYFEFASKEDLDEHLRTVKHYKGYDIDSSDPKEKDFNNNVAFAWHVHGEKGYDPFIYNRTLYITDIERVFSHYAIKNHEHEYASVIHNHDDLYAKKGHTHGLDFALKNHKHEEFLKVKDCDYEMPFKGSLNYYFMENGDYPYYYDNRCYDSKVESIEDIDLTLIKPYISIKFITVLDTSVIGFIKDFESIILEINGVINKNAKVHYRYSYLDDNNIQIEISFYKKEFNKDIFGDIRKINFYLMKENNLFKIKDSYTNLFLLREYDKAFVKNTFCGMNYNSLSGEILLDNDYFEENQNIKGEIKYNFTFSPNKDTTLGFKNELLGSLQWKINNEKMIDNATILFNSDSKVFDYEEIKNWEIGVNDKTSITVQDNSNSIEKYIKFGKFNNNYLTKLFDSSDDHIFEENVFGIKFSLKPLEETPRNTDQVILHKDYLEESEEGYFELGINISENGKRSFLYIDFIPRKLMYIYDEKEKYMTRSNSILFKYCRFKFYIDIQFNQWNDFIINKEIYSIEVIKDNETIKDIECERFNDIDNRDYIYIPYNKSKEYMIFMDQIPYYKTYKYSFSVGGSYNRIYNALRSCMIYDLALHDDILDVNNEVTNINFRYKVEKNKEYNMEIIYRTPRNGQKYFYPRIGDLISDIEIEDNHYLDINNNSLLFRIYTKDLIGNYLEGDSEKSILSKYNIEYCRCTKFNNTYAKKTISGNVLDLCPLREIFNIDLNKFYKTEEIVRSEEIIDSDEDLNELEFNLSLSNDSAKIKIISDIAYIKVDDNPPVLVERELELTINDNPINDINIRVISNGPIEIIVNDENIDSYYYNNYNEPEGNASKFIKEESEEKEWNIPLESEEDVFPFVFVIDNFGRQIPFFRNNEYTEDTAFDGIFALGRVDNGNLILEFYKKYRFELEKIYMNGRALIMF